MAAIKVSVPSGRSAAIKKFNFAEAIAENAPDFRKQAFARLANASLPLTTEEAWRRTDLRSFQPDRYRFGGRVGEVDLEAIPAEKFESLVDDHFGGKVVVTPDGAYVNVSDEVTKTGVIFTDIATAEREYPELISKILGKTVSSDESIFATIAGAFGNHGVFVYVPKDVEVKQPLQSLFWASGQDIAFITNLIVHLEENSTLTLVHESASAENLEENIFSSSNVEIHVADGANLRFVELQSWGPSVYNFSHERSKVGKDANLDWIFGSIGSKLTKNFSDLDLVGKGAVGRMSGFYITDGKQHLDHDTQQNHYEAKTQSDLLFKGALLGKSRSVWQGMIYVAPDAQQTDGYQANRNLILSEDARADSIPGLEILADDVRCTHGATVGKLEEEPLFYLRSRGIPKNDAARLVVEGFFDPIMQRIPFEGVRERFKSAIMEKMDRNSN